MKKIVLIFFAILSFSIQAQVVPDSVVVDTLEVLVAEEEMLYKEDSADFVFYTTPSEVEYIPGDDHPSIIKERMECIKKTVPLIYNDKVHSFINYFTVRDREYTRMVARRMNLYFPLFEKFLAKYGMPDELKYLSIIESGLNPKAISRARAVGLWQFMSATGRHYGLHNDWYIDERMDPERATDAACKYLRDLYSIFHDWELALAAYNTGPGNVKRAIRRSGYKRSFWQIYPYLPRETRSYVPQFTAITYTMHYLAEHNFGNVGEELRMPSDTLFIKKYLHLETLAELTNGCLEDIQKLNPSVLRSAIPDLTKPFILHVPISLKENLLQNRLAILDSASKVGRKELEALARNSEGSTYGRDRIIYKVKYGDVLGAIAIRYGVSVNSLKKWNNLRSNMIRTGQRLNIWIRPSLYDSSVASVKKVQPVPIPGSKIYTVQPGDTLWDISRKFEGLTIEKIKNLNNLNSNRIEPGQTLVIGI